MSVTWLALSAPPVCYTPTASWTSPSDRCPCLAGQPAGSHQGSEAVGLHICWPVECLGTVKRAGAERRPNGRHVST